MSAALTACAGHFPLIARRNWRIMSIEVCSTVASWYIPILIVVTA
jgi:hypothetical protein